ncbi:MAG: VPLPA-CTERM sorting domain-containing protein [Aestuariivirga sp.]|nr:VPLPA-CTERM sorting domain-containing protein [Aestuariivirga sp.]
MILYQHIGRKLVVALGFACAAYSSQAIASTIVAPVTAVASSEFIASGFDFSIENTIDKSGLSFGYVSGVTDFDAYLASGPTHTSNANGNEWFSENFGGSSVAGLTVTYGFSALTSINGFALWNEDFAGLGSTLLQYSVNGSTYTDLMTITPVPSEFAEAGEVVPYLAQVFSFSLTDMLFFRLVIADCPGPPPSESSFRGCGIGEVAFSAILPPPPGPVDNNPVVPLPAALPLFGSALGLFVWMGRRRKSCS